MIKLSNLQYFEKDSLYCFIIKGKSFSSKVAATYDNFNKFVEDLIECRSKSWRLTELLVLILQ
jgi:hypothetical protein